MHLVLMWQNTNPILQWGSWFTQGHISSYKVAELGFDPSFVYYIMIAGGTANILACHLKVEPVSITVLLKFEVQERLGTSENFLDKAAEVYNCWTCFLHCRTCMKTTFKHWSVETDVLAQQHTRELMAENL